MRPLALLMMGLLVLGPATGGCLEDLGLGGLARPDYAVSRTPVQTEGWNTDSTFTVQVKQDQPVEVRIEADPAGARPALATSGFSNATTPIHLEIPDGTWTITYFVGDHEWETFKDARFDTTAPEITGLPTVVRTPDGSAVVGEGAEVEARADIVVTKQDGSPVADALPFEVSGLPDGVHVYQVVATDEAGNEFSITVQVVSGDATALPDPQYTAGIIARYTTELRLWDLTVLDSFLSPAAARAQAPGHLGSGKGVTPDDPAVQAVVADVVQPGMTTGEAALELYKWMYEKLEYNHDRLEEDDLLDPAQTIEDGGGVCRDLAGLYASLLRAAGIPARLVAGYLAGEVNGFHAWVEFYGGVGPSPWVPVDVSGIGSSKDPDDDGYRVAGMLQAFGIALPEHLAMRALTAEEEQTDWSTAAILLYQGGQPDAPFLKDVEVLFETEQDLCINTETLARASRSRCGNEHNARIQGFPVVASRVLDYGIDVRDAPSGTKLTLSIVYPDLVTVEPDEVVYQAYFRPNQAGGGTRLSSGGFEEDPATGRSTAEIRA
ncbi:MAG TPA: transglutaminase-like domain-containing protein [Candidatus Thermoplasmatota archaeon]|nr:transglutaminase-like domain-containing protein [Candidatus Thermoplasmatota archaeon]